MEKKREEAENLTKTNSFDEQTFPYFFTKLCSFYYSNFQIKSYNAFKKLHEIDIFTKLKNFSSMFKKFDLPFSIFYIKSKKKKNDRKEGIVVFHLKMK